MPSTKDENLFRESTMTFGQHLEELRSCLVKSAMALALGFILGLFVGGKVVGFIQLPLTRALTSYFQKQAESNATKELTKLQEAGHSLPGSIAELEHRIYTEQLLPQEVFVDPEQLLTQLRVDPSVLKRLPPEPSSSATAVPAPAEATPTEAPATAEKPATETPSADSNGVSPKKLPKQLAPVFIWHRLADDARLRVKSMNAQEAFTIYVKASLLVGLLIASPLIFYQIWSFVAAGLYLHERRYVHMYLPFSIGLFLLGAAVAFFLVFEPVLTFLLEFNASQGIEPDPRINEWLSFVLMLPVGFGVGFQLPLVMLFCERIGIVSVQGYLKQWRVAVLVIFVLAALLTPPDPYSMSLLAVPLTFLYFGGILLCKYLPRGRGLLAPRTGE